MAGKVADSNSLETSDTAVTPQILDAPPVRRLGQFLSSYIQTGKRD